MKSKQLFDDFEEDIKTSVKAKKKPLDKDKKSSDKTNQKEVKTKKNIKRDDSRINNSTISKNNNSSRNNTSIIFDAGNNNTSKTDKKGTKSVKRVSKINGSSKQESRKVKKDNASKPHVVSKNNKEPGRSTKNKIDRARKQSENDTTTNIKSIEETKKLSELIEDYKKWNAPKEYLIGKINETTKKPYVQLSCCKRGWTYIDVTDIKWLKEHIGSK